MAIKGKKKNKGARKHKPSAPRKAVVTPEQPLITRKSFQITIASIIALVVGLGLGYGFGNQETLEAASSASAATTQADKTFGTELDAILLMAGQPTGDGFVPFASLDTAIQRIDDDEDVALARKDLRSVGENASAVNEALSTMDITAMTRDVPARDIADLFGIREQLAQGATLFGQTARLLDQAAQATGRDRKELVGAAIELKATAASVFDEGYRRYQNVMLASGAVQPAPTGNDPLPGQDPSALLPPDPAAIPPQPQQPADPASQQAP